MRYGMSILVLVAVLAIGVGACADTIILLERGGATNADAPSGSTDTVFDDAMIDIGGGDDEETNYGNDDPLLLHTFTGGWVDQYILVGIKDLFTLLPGTNGGAIVIDDAELRLVQKLNTATDSIAVRRVTSDWLLTTAGNNETNVSGGERDMTNDLEWAAVDDFSDADYTETGGSATNAPGGNGLAQTWDVTTIVQDMYTNNQNNGFVIFPVITSGSASVAYNSSEATWSEANRPRLTIDYHYSGGAVPEPGTMLLLGSGVLGMIGYMRRKGMA